MHVFYDRKFYMCCFSVTHWFSTLWIWNFFSPPVHLCAVTSITEISLHVTLSNQSHSLTHEQNVPHARILWLKVLYVLLFCYILVFNLMDLELLLQSACPSVPSHVWLKYRCMWRKISIKSNSTGSVISNCFILRSLIFGKGNPATEFRLFLSTWKISTMKKIETVESILSLMDPRLFP